MALIPGAEMVATVLLTDHCCSVVETAARTTAVQSHVDLESREGEGKPNGLLFMFKIWGVFWCIYREGVN